MLSQQEVDELLTMIKILKHNGPLEFPEPGKALKMDAVGEENNEKFIIDVNRKGQIKIRCTYQTRYGKSIILLRIDLVGGKHINPDGTIVECPHIHIYREGYEDRWAYPLKDVIDIQNSFDLIEVLLKFLEYNKIKNIPTEIGYSLF